MFAQRSIRIRHLMFVSAVIVTLVSTACVPEPGGMGGSTTTSSTTTTIGNGTNQPVINSLTVASNSGVSPLANGLSWNLSDADNSILTCSIDWDGDGSDDEVIQNCGYVSGVTHSYTGSFFDDYDTKLTVTDNMTAPVSQTVNVNLEGPPGETFDITAVIDGGVSAEVTNLINQAVARWQTIITAGYGNLNNLNVPANSCDATHSAYNGSVDDIVIDFSTPSLDGQGGTLAYGGPCIVDGSGKPRFAIIGIDSGDVASSIANGSLADTIVHEIGHALGFGVLWDHLAINTGTSSSQYIGAVGNAAYHSLGGNGNIPLETTGGPGTADSHFDEVVFQSELMSGYSDIGVVNPLSILTVGAMADLGYEGVDLSAADPYSLPQLALRRERSVKVNRREYSITPNNEIVATTS